MKIRKFLPALIVRTVLLLLLIILYVGFAIQFDKLHDFTVSSAPLFWPFALFEPAQYANNFVKLLLPGFLFWLSFFLVWKLTPRRLTHPPSSSTFYRAAPWLLGLIVVHLSLSLVIAFSLSSVLSPLTILLSPLLPWVLVVFVLTGNAADIASLSLTDALGTIIFWSIVAIIFFVKRKSKPNRL